MARILLVEDSKVQALVTRHLMERAGYQVEHAANAEEAVKQCYGNAPDLVVSDQELGEVSGLEVCRRIKSDVALSVIPVLMLTGTQSQKHQVAALDAGADAFLSKDSSSDALLAIVSRLLESTAGVQALAAGQDATGRTAYRTRILAVDDSRTFLAALSRKLTEAGFDATGASAGSEALSLLDQKPFDVVVTDLVMPEMDGFEFSRQARQWAVERNRQLGLLVLTGTERKDVMVQSLDAGADDYVNKAQDMDVIVAHTTALARRISRTRQIESMNQETLRKELELREAELKRQQAEERARLADELEIANQTLAQSNEQLEQFARVASHDLQAPLRRIILFCQLLQSSAKDELANESNELIEGIVQCTGGMQRLVSDLLLYSRIDMHDQPREPVDSSAVFSEVLNNLEVTIRESGAIVTRDELPTLPAYRTQLVQLLQNLIGNAIHYRGDKPPLIHLAATKSDGPWKFSVTDNGIGIDPEYHERIFVMFKRLHGDERSGTGIGLATCRKIVERHDGRIWVESQPGKGSTFWFTIPAGTEPA